MYGSPGAKDLRIFLPCNDITASLQDRCLAGGELATGYLVALHVGLRPES